MGQQTSVAGYKDSFDSRRPQLEIKNETYLVFDSLGLVAGGGDGG